MSDWLSRLPWPLVLLWLIFRFSLPALAVDSPPAGWTNPGAITLKMMGPAASVPAAPYAFPSLDCDQISYRPVGLTSAMQEGCFTPTAFGLLNSDQQAVIFNGSDEALPLVTYSAHELLLAWPEAAAALALDSVATDGQTLSLYKDLPAELRDQRNLLGQLVAKQVTAPPDLTIRDTQGHNLIINPQTLSFSPGASWLVVEALNGSFVRINLASLQVTAFAPAFNSLSGPSLSQSEVAVSDDGRYVAIANRQATSFKVYDLANCAANLCASHDYWPYLASQYNGLQAIGHVRFINNALLSFNAAGGTGSQAANYVLTPADRIGSLLDYLGLGDSYTSGEGAFDYLLGTDTAENRCHLSRRSYPLLITDDLFGTNGGHSVACSGAVINDVGSTSNSYVGQMASGQSYSALQQDVPAFLLDLQTNFLPGYIAQQRFVRQYQPATVSVSVGGDDAGFGDILERCVEPHVSRYQSDQTCFNTYEDRQEIIEAIDKTQPRLIALYRQLLRESPASHLYVIGYPQIVVDDGDCALNVHLNTSELEFAVELVNYLNDNMRRAAASAGAQYVDISQALKGHRLCETKSFNVAVNGLTAGKDGGLLGLKVFGKESYHPTALGQYLIEQAILRQTNNLHNWSPPASVPVKDSQKLLSAPKSGRSLRSLVLGKKLAPPSLSRGQSTTIHLNGSQVGLSANHVYLIQLDGPGGPIIGSLASTSNGNIDGSVTIPANTVTGGHSLDLSGQNQAGEPIDVSQPIYIIDSSFDSDGDSLPDSTDSCPTAINSGQDADQDGIDDTCDGFIGTINNTGNTAYANTVRLTASVQTKPSSAQVRPAPSQPISHTTRPIKASMAGRVLGTISASTIGSSKLWAHPQFCWAILLSLGGSLLLFLLLLWLAYKLIRRQADGE